MRLSLPGVEELRGLGDFVMLKLGQGARQLFSILRGVILLRNGLYLLDGNELSFSELSLRLHAELLLFEERIHPSQDALVLWRDIAL